MELHPSCFWMRFAPYAACSIWQAHHGLEDYAHADLSTVDLDAGEDALITRPRFDVRVTRLPTGAVELLDSLARGEPLGEAFEQASAASAKVDSSSLFLVLISQGLVSRFLTSQES